MVNGDVREDNIRAYYDPATGVHRIDLDRPAALNAINSAMIDAITRVLEEWAESDAVERVRISGGPPGFCSGADVREMRSMIVDGWGDPVDFLAREDRMDYLVATYPKPVEAYLWGYAMGGGLGLVANAPSRIAQTGTRFAMPETRIGLWPDVGMTYHLSRMPGEIGTYMALTSGEITAAQAVEYGLCTELVAGKGEVEPSRDVPDWGWMADAFAGDDVVEIVGRLEDHPLEEARKAGAELRKRAPLSVAVTLRALRRAAGMTLEEVYAQDLKLGSFFCYHPDFVEGVRAQLVDKDRNPRWTHARVEEVTEAEVRKAFGEEY